ncbi:MAG: hypothetical protein CBC13_03880 [Planctomycetia bacterium TMED53]|nr:MAG: hypothetical protein CBC13_03880 [Planctomycetia bacterium TMED53]
MSGHITKSTHFVQTLFIKRLPLLLGLGLLVLTLSSPLQSFGAEPAEPNVPEKTSGFFSRDLIEDLWSEDVRVERSIVPIEGELKEEIVKLSRVKTSDQHTALFRISSDLGEAMGHVVILDEVGKYRPITFLVALDNKERVVDLQVLVYREHIGKEIESRRFTRQFRDKKITSTLKLHRDIRNLSGATLSARAAVRAVRRSLATVKLTRQRGTELAWLPISGPNLFYGESQLGFPVPASEKDEDVLKRASRESSAKPFERARPAMGTILKMEVHGDDALNAVEAAFTEVARLESLHSRWKQGSDVLNVENAPVGTAVEVSSDTIEVVEQALQVSRESGGAFDLTLQKDGYLSVRVDAENQTITLLKPGLILDLGGIGKGFALDRAAQVLESHGCRRALLDFGGQLLALDPPPGESSWPVGIFDPRDGKTVLYQLPLVRSSLATTALYERGEHLIHLLDNDPAIRILTTSVISESATQADALSTTVALIDQDKAQQLLESRSDASAVILLEGEDEPRVMGRF